MIPPTVKSITCAELYQKSLNEPVELIDVRTVEEFNEIRAAGARNLPLDQFNVAALIQSQRNTAEPIYFICAVGGRSAWACEVMMAAGYENVVNVEGGTQQWYSAGLPVERGTS
jgi:rhodanese-related sulfurtransferase